MKRFLALGLCLLLCAALLCGCDSVKGGDVSVDLNAMVHTLDDFRNGDVSCQVTYEYASDTTATAAESGEEETESYVFKGQQAVDLYNLLNRSNWVEMDGTTQPTGVYTQMMTLDFYAGSSLEKATEYFGSFTVSNQNLMVMSASPYDLSLATSMAPEDTFDALCAYVAEKQEEKE